jgi:hypothetical protein
MEHIESNLALALTFACSRLDLFIIIPVDRLNTTDLVTSYTFMDHLGQYAEALFSIQFGCWI